jgi:hypothetical protein
MSWFYICIECIPSQPNHRRLLLATRGAAYKSIGRIKPMVIYIDHLCTMQEAKHMQVRNEGVYLNIGKMQRGYEESALVVGAPRAYM